MPSSWTVKCKSWEPTTYFYSTDLIENRNHKNYYLGLLVPYREGRQIIWWCLTAKYQLTSAFKKSKTQHLHPTKDSTKEDTTGQQKWQRVIWTKVQPRILAHWSQWLLSKGWAWNWKYLITFAKISTWYVQQWTLPSRLTQPGVSPSYEA